jgi:multidrug efflux pump subunit AcrB
VYAARRRVVPIIITSTTTIAGLFSLAVGLGGHSLIWGPMAASIVWGIGFSTVLTLFAMPLLYWALMPEHRSRRGPTPYNAAPPREIGR